MGVWGADRGSAAALSVDPRSFRAGRGVRGGFSWRAAAPWPALPLVAAAGVARNADRVGGAGESGRRARVLCRRSCRPPADDAEESSSGSGALVQEVEPRSQVVCVVPAAELRYTSVPEDPAEVQRDFFKNIAIFVLPFAGPAVAFGSWSNILALVHLALPQEQNLLELTQLTLNPTTNGIVVACLASALGTLTSITAWSLRSRQLDLRSTINRESAECQMLATRLVASAPLASPDELVTHVQMLALTRQYVVRILAESCKAVDIMQLEAQGASNNELNGIMRAARGCQVPRTLVDDVAAHVAKLNDARSTRLATLTTAFPLIHWVILALLGASISTCFLIEVDQYEGRFLTERPEDSLRLRIIFTMLVGTFSGLTALCADLNDPFRGSFNISGATRQLVSILASIDKDLEGWLLELNPALSKGELEREMKQETRRIGTSGERIMDFNRVMSWLRSKAGM